MLALALSGDGKYLASGGKDRKVGVWDVEKEEWVKGFGGHKDSISVSDQTISRGPLNFIIPGSCIPQRHTAALQRLL